MKTFKLILKRGTMERVQQYTSLELAQAAKAQHGATGYWDEIRIEGGL